MMSIDKKIINKKRGVVWMEKEWLGIEICIRERELRWEEREWRWR